MNVGRIRERLEIDNPHVTDADLVRAVASIRRFLNVEQGRAGYWMDTEQFEVEANLALWHAARTYDPARGTLFATHAVNWVRWRLGLAKRPMMPLGLAAVQRAKRQQKAGQEPGPNLMVPVSLDGCPAAQEYLTSLTVWDEDPLATNSTLDCCERILAHLHLLGDTQRRHLLAYVQHGSCRAAAKACGMTPQGISRSVVIARELLRPLLAREAP
jgi:hypothetical protein